MLDKCIASYTACSPPPPPAQERVYHVTIPGTFVEVELPGSAPLFKEGEVLRKNIMDGPHRKGEEGGHTLEQEFVM